MAILTGQDRVVTMVAVMDSRLLELRMKEFHELLQKVPGLAANVSRALGFRLRNETTGQKMRNISRVIGIFNPSGYASDILMYERLVNQLISGLIAERIPIRIITDRADAVHDHERFHISEIPRNMNASAKADWIHQRLSEDIGHEGHTLVCLSNANSESLSRILLQCEEILWLSTPEHESQARTKFFYLLAR